MSLSLLKRTIRDLSSDSEEKLPKKRESSDKYKELISEDINNRLLRKAKLSKKERAKKAKVPSKPLLEKLESKYTSSISDHSIQNLSVIKSRSLPKKYITLLSKPKNA
jgi:hypothetical protein